jgi:hypothetical protein
MHLDGGENYRLSKAEFARVIRKSWKSLGSPLPLALMAFPAWIEILNAVSLFVLGWLFSYNYHKAKNESKTNQRNNLRN